MLHALTLITDIRRNGRRLERNNNAMPMDSASLSSASLLFSAKISPEDNTITDPARLPLLNLSMLQQRIDSLQRFLHQNVQTNTLIGGDQMYLVSNEIASTIQQVIVNGVALLACYPQKLPILQRDVVSKPPAIIGSSTEISRKKKRVKEDDEIDDGDYEIVEMDAVELLAENIHRCEICGKGFKRDANLRMHKRAHGNQFKTLEALTRPDRKERGYTRRKTRFSCPFIGCNRNKSNSGFKPLKSAICLKNHFKRSHCPKLFSCNRCNKKSFSVVADLKSHQKHCGKLKWRCSCGMSFPRKHKLFGHMALFEGHMPAVSVPDEDDESKREASRKRAALQEEEEDDDLEEDDEEEDIELETEVKPKNNSSDDVVQLDGFGGINEGRCLTDEFGIQIPSIGLGVSASLSDMDEFQGLWWSGPC